MGDVCNLLGAVRVTEFDCYTGFVSSIVSVGQTISAISTPVDYDAAGQFDGNTTSVSAPVEWGDADSCVYYTIISWANDGIGLPPSRAFEFGISAAQGRTNDYSFNGTDASFTANPHITVYYNGQPVYGTEP